ncbi:hypothetical protein HPB52_005315 [Rhipicephalus sanguineus]|uniref:HTH psq-type domain-containing protein n=1 Tax=Rhipicephalus sanguineus TaxID=34632 RepID=A0A9D4PVN4_RHISA|nr:hypothetical protein HPB52_005315 [Rhipicephalus sanguineus]
MSNRQVKHHVLTIKEKLDIVNAIQRGTKKSALAREKGLPLTTFVVPAQPTSPSVADATEEDIDDSECEALIAEVLEGQGGGDKVPFNTFCDVDKEVETCEDLSDSDIINSVCGKLPSASDGDEEEDDNNAEPEDVPCPSVAEAARALDVMRVFAEKNGLMDKLAIHLDGFEAAVVAARPPKRQTRVTDFWRPISTE